MNYEEAVIIPMDVFTKCNFTSAEKKPAVKTSDEIINDAALPSDIKVKLFNQKKKLTKIPLPEPQVVKIQKEVQQFPSEDIIINQFPIKTRPVVYLLLKYIKDSGGVLSWTDDLEIRIGGKKIQDSNIVQLLKFVTNNLIVTSPKDVPVGAEDFVNALQDIGVPKQYIQLPRRSARRSEWLKF